MLEGPNLGASLLHSSKALWVHRNCLRQPQWQKSKRSWRTAALEDSSSTGKRESKEGSATFQKGIAFQTWLNSESSSDWSPLANANFNRNWSSEAVTDIFVFTFSSRSSISKLLLMFTVGLADISFSFSITFNIPVNKSYFFSELIFFKGLCGSFPNWKVS